MAGLRGNNAWWAYKVQSAKGTPAAFVETETPAAKQKGFKVPFSGGSIEPGRTFGQLAETDASRDRGVSYAKVGGMSGTPEAYVRDDSIGALLYYTLGADASTGPVNFNHVITPANTVPYVTFWRMLSETLYEQFTDCMVSSLNIKTTAGEPLTAAASVVGIKSTRLTTDPTKEVGTAKINIPLDNNYVYNMNDAFNGSVELSGGVTHLISSFDLTINNNVSPQQTDSFTPYDVVAGQREVSLSFDMVFENLIEYNKFFYGTETGTAESNTLYTTSAMFNFSHGVNNAIKFILPSIAYETFPIAPNTTGAPVVASVKAVGQRTTNIVTAEVKNQIEKYV